MGIVKTNAASYELLKLAIEARDIIYLYGPSSSGKTYLARKALEEDRRILYALIDCNVITTSSKLYIQIISSLKRELNIQNLRGKSIAIPKLLGLLEFLQIYQNIVKTANDKGFSKIYIVLDRLDLLRKTAVLDCLIALAGCDQMNLICISIESPYDILSEIKSVVSKENIYNRSCFISLTPWTKSDIVETICMEVALKEPDLYKKFVNNVVNIVYTNNTRDFVEIKAFCQENYPQFYRYYAEKFKETTRKSIKNTRRLTKDSGEAGSMNIIGTFLETVKEMVRQKDIRSWNQDSVDRKVVLGTSMLILAAYIAAYTKPADDRRNFVKFQKKKVLNRDRDKRNRDEAMTARPFTLERLLHVYKGISLSIHGESVDSKIVNLRAELPNSVIGDVQLLEEYNMIEVTSGDVFGSQTRYKCSSCISRDYVNRIANQINFNLDHIYGLP